MKILICIPSQTMTFDSENEYDVSIREDSVNNDNYSNIDFETKDLYGGYFS